MKVLHPYKEAIKNLPKNAPLTFATLTIKNGWDAKERIDFAFKSLTRLYELKIFGKRKWKEVKRAFFEELKAYRQNLKNAKGKDGKPKYSPKEIRKIVKTQIRYFKRFIRRYKNLPKSEKLKFGQVISAVWVFELTKSEAGYHPHWHGIVLAEIPKVLLTALWKMATKGDAYITDIRKVSSPTEAIEYVEDYVADGFVDVGQNFELGKNGGKIEGALKDELVEIEEALHGRRKVRAWGFDLMRGQQFGQLTNSSSYIWAHAYGLKLKLLDQSQKSNLHDYWGAYRKARKEGKRQPYLALEVIEAQFFFGRSRYVLLGYLRPDGLIEIEPFNESDKEDWREFIEALFDYNGNVFELCRLPSEMTGGSIDYEALLDVAF